MSWTFSMEVECGSNPADAARFMGFFDGWTPDIDGRKPTLKLNTHVDTDSNSWVSVIVPLLYLKGMSFGPHTTQGASEIQTATDVLLRRLKLAPPFRFAMCGVEMFEFEKYRFMQHMAEKISAYRGLVISSHLYEDFRKPEAFLPFADGTYWIPLALSKIDFYPATFWFLFDWFVPDGLIDRDFQLYFERPQSFFPFLDLIDDVYWQHLN